MTAVSHQLSTTDSKRRLAAGTNIVVVAYPYNRGSYSPRVRGQLTPTYTGLHIGLLGDQAISLLLITQSVVRGALCLHTNERTDWVSCHHLLLRYCIIKELAAHESLERDNKGDAQAVHRRQRLSTNKPVHLDHTKVVHVRRLVVVYVAWTLAVVRACMSIASELASDETFSESFSPSVARSLNPRTCDTTL